MIKVCISPSFTKPDRADGGIRRVVEAQRKYLPQFGVEVVDNPSEAHIICNHGATLTEIPQIPSVNVCHGFYWSRQPWEAGYQEVNAQVFESMRHAVAHTAPSQWVANAIRRGGYFYPEVVYHGLDGDDFLPSAQHGDYVVWNKARADFVSNPEDMLKVATVLPGVKFVSTIGRPSDNVKITGPMPHSQMKKIVSEANVYLSTVRETFGIGILEAMAYGIPVAGFDWGGNSEIIVHGETGYLAPPGDFGALAECIQMCIRERERLSANCIADVRERWKWQPRIKQYADIFQRVYEYYYERKKAPKVSVIVTAYKLDHYLPKCLESIQKQSYVDFECLVVDDAQLESTETIVRAFSRRDKRFKYKPTPENFGLPGARNYGATLSRGLYVRHVDADDFLAENCLELEVGALDNDWGIDIAYGHLEVVREDGSRVMENGTPVRGGWPTEQFDWFGQMSHLNQIPSCAMARRSVFERSGGYRLRMTRNEDAEFWCRVTSLGFRAKKITQAVTYFHRERTDSKGAVEWRTEGSEPDWTAWFPWRLGATNLEQARQVARKTGNEHPKPELVPFGAQGKPPAPLRFWYVHDYAYPAVSIIVTCGPGHKQYLQDALDSVQAQTFPDWECVVVNDTGKEWPKNIPGAPWAKVVSTEGNLGASAARNVGYRQTTGKYIVWMDADDYWLPWYLEKMVGMALQNDGLIFSDLLMHDYPKKFKVYKYDEFDCEKVAVSFRYPGTSVLIPRKITEAVRDKQGGWDEKTPGMEDWDYAVAIHDLGFCAYHIPEPLFVYRVYSSTKREKDYNGIEAIRAYMDKKWSKYRKDGVHMGCGCGSKNSATKAKILTSSGDFRELSDLQSKAFTSEDGQQMVKMEYVGPMIEPFSIASREMPSIRYRFANTPSNKQRAVLVQDVPYLAGLTGPDGSPLYRVVDSNFLTPTSEASAFLGTPVQA